MNEICCRRRERPAWQLLLGSRDFGAIMLLNAMMFMTQNGSRAVLVPLLATQAFGVTTTTLGDLRPTHPDCAILPGLSFKYGAMHCLLALP